MRVLVCLFVCALGSVSVASALRWPHDFLNQTKEVQFSVRLATGSSDLIKLWDLNTGECVQNLTDGDFFETVTFLARLEGDTGDGQPPLLVSATNYAIKVWNVTSGACLHTINSQWTALNVRALVGVDERTVAAGTDDPYVRLWDVYTGLCVRTFTGHVDDVSALVLVDSRTLASGSQASFPIFHLSFLTFIEITEKEVPYSLDNKKGS